ncbi:carbohydrate-binding protein [Luedemannella helvata]
MRRALVTAAAVVAGLGVATPALAVPPDPTGPVTFGTYANQVHYTGDEQSTRGWKISWEIPTMTNASQAWMAVGQWYFGFESGVYHTPGEGWWVYYYGDQDGLTGNNPDCDEAWGEGGHCRGAMENLSPGDHVTFTYQWCNASGVADLSGQYNCIWVDMHDGVGDRFLAKEYRLNQTVEMYTHEVENFGDVSPVTYPEPIIPCNAPVRMLGQQLKSPTGSWLNMTGNLWDFVNGNPAPPRAQYQYQNINTSASPATWESCSVPPPACPAAWNASTLYETGQEVGHNGHKWRARWWTYANEPGVTNAWDDLGAC